MTALDLASDPMQSTVLGDWIWRDGGAYFGVPIHNFVGCFVAATGTFALAMAGVAAFAVLPILLAAILSLRRQRP